MATKTSICNRALYRVGHNKKLTNVDTDTSLAGEICREVFEAVRDEVLAAFPWKFAAHNAILAQAAGQERVPWTYAYALPADCLKPIELWLGKRRPRTDEKTAFTVEANDAQTATLLLCDVEPITTVGQESPVLRYTRQITLIPVWPVLFCDAVAWRLAVELALALPNKRELRGDAWTGYQAAVAEAQTNDLENEQLDPEPESKFIADRS